MSQQVCPVNTRKYSNPDKSAAAGAADGAETALLDPDLQLVVEAWENLPEATRAGILAMIQAAR
jgi:hypothetical protein